MRSDPSSVSTAIWLTSSLPVVKGRITSASSRVHRTLTSSTAESSQHHEPWPEASALPSRLAQAFDQVGVVLAPKPRDAVVHVHLECRRCIRNGLLQPLPRFCCATQLAESSGRPAIDHREIRIRADQPFPRLDNALGFTSKIKTAGNVQQAHSHKRIAGIEPDTGFESFEPFHGLSRKD